MNVVREDFQTSPEKLEEALPKARRTAGADGYDYVHSHLDIPGPGPDGPGFQCTADWATSQSGSCSGNFLGGTAPFDRVRGETRWEKVGAVKGRSLPPELRGIPGLGESGILITQATDSGKRIECLIADRSRGDCYTQAGQQGKPMNTPGGPLWLDAEFPSHGDTYVLLRGYCEQEDPRCAPH